MYDRCFCSQIILPSYILTNNQRLWVRFPPLAPLDLPSFRKRANFFFKRFRKSNQQATDTNPAVSSKKVLY